MEDFIVNASPTKEFFIQMLTKDIKLERAIIDLIDNSIDGVKRIRGAGESFEGLWIELTISATEFSIKDNCGGFSLNTAKNYAFMIGRPEGGELIKNSVGRFGVGMKRALFKIGKSFEVESNSEKDHFQVEVDVNEWSKTTESWNFQYSNVDRSTDNLDEIQGTFIKVNHLNEDVIDEFSSAIFLSGLSLEIERTLSFFIDKGLTIRLNGVKLNKSKITLLHSEYLKPFYKNIQIKGVDIKIYAGIGKASPEMAGWYIYCNDRLVLEKDKTNLTGWEGKRIGESNIQKFHHIYAMFRGIVFFSSEDSRLLPMTTTKTGVDSNSSVYKATRQEMIFAMSQVISFLKTFESDEQRNEIISASDEIDVISLKKSQYENKFIFPEVSRLSAVNESTTVISYRAEIELVEMAKKFFEVSTNKEVGISTFNYFLKLEKENI